MPDSDKTSRITSRVTPNERRAVEIMAGRENLDLSEMLRVLIHEAAEERGLQKMGLIHLTSILERRNEQSQP